nr:AAA family ATPase [Polyangium aurulentum]
MSAQISYSTPMSEFRGQPLDKLCREPMEIEAFLRCAVRVAGALAEMHHGGVIHKNIKPQSILFDGDTSEVRITDMSLAVRLPREQPAVKAPSVIEGTLPYMSPEQTGRMNRWVDNRSDLYSLGVTFYEMLTGKLPFEASDPLEWVHCHIARVPLPPAELRPAIPRPVSDIVMKLLAKVAEDRYQSAHGLRLDLEACLARWQSTRQIAPFPLGVNDVTDRFQIPQKLHGREEESRALIDAFERVAQHGRAELLLVSGYSGIGKSSLVQELHKPIVRRRGSFVSGKFDQYKRDIPYATIVQAFRQLVLEMLTASEQELGAVRQQLRSALGANGQLMIDMVPEVELIIGKQAPVPELSTGDAQNRQNLVFRQFLGVLASAEHPVVIFLDDLQWADSGSLGLIAHLASHHEVRHVLLIGAYRDNEVSPSHPLMLALDDLRKSGASVRSIVLGPLSAEHLGRLVAGALHQRPDEVAPLACLVLEKTAGNPFFAIQFLMRLHQEQLITHDVQAAAFRWDLAKIQAKRFTDNVVDLLVDRLKQLPPETQETVELAACLGSQIDVHTLAIISNRTEAETRARLWGSVSEGLMLADGDTYHFLHDRVQQAGYSLVEDGARAALHLRIGRLLLAHTPPESIGERIFEIVGQLNLGAACITDAAEKRRLAELNLQAGRRAKASSAWQSAARFLAQGIEQLPPDAWAADHGLSYALHFELAESEHLSARYEEAERLIGILLDRCGGKLDRASIHRLEVELHFGKGEVRRSVDAGIEGLRLFGIDLPPQPSWEQVQAEYAQVRRNLNGRPIEALVDLPLMTDPDMRAAMRILGVFWASALSSDANLLALYLGRMVNLCLQYGNVDAAILGYTWWGITLINTFHEYEEGYRFGKLARDVMAKHGFAAYEAKLNYSLELITAWVDDLQKAVDLAKAGFLAGIERGDLSVAGFCCNHIVALILAQGTPLKEVHEEAERRLTFVRGARFQYLVEIIENMQRYVQSLRGLTRSLSTFSDDHFDEDAFEAGFTPERMPGMVFWYWILKTQSRFISGALDQALSASQRARAMLWANPACHLQFHDYHLYSALVLAAVYANASPDEQREYDDRLAAHLAQLAEWAESSPKTFRASHALVSAEIARIGGNALAAGEHYEQAIGAARAGGFVQHEALANELAGRFYLGRGLATAAKGYLQEAHACYARWGADGKVQQLEQLYPELRGSMALSATATFAATPQQIDILSVAKASQSISSEIVLSKLAETLLRIVLEAAGAEKGCLIRPRLRDHGSDWAVEVEAMVGGADRKIEVRHGHEEICSADMPEAILNYVKRTREQVLLDDATTDPRFSGSSYIARQRPKSVLCLPLMRQSEFMGAVYLENNLTAGAFTPDRLLVLGILVSQAAISLENATLYANLTQENAERKRAEAEARKLNEELELRVLDRTAQLSVANRELEAFSSSVSHDLRAPLRTINGFSLALQEDYGDTLDDEAKGYLNHIRAASRKMGSLIDDMINLSRVTRSEMERRKVDLSALVREVNAELRMEHQERKVDVVIADGLSTSGDERLLRIAVQNLLGNAWKFTSKRAHARIEFGCLEQPAGRTAYFVRDDGAGFDMSRASKLFTAFERLHTSSDFAGTGIGLATVQRVIDRHGGRVWAESAPGQGATFYFTL